jgi:hypothetical protein
MLDQFEVKQRYNEYLREAEQERLYQRIKANQSNRRQPILMRLGDLLIAVGQHLKAETVPKQIFTGSEPSIDATKTL